MHGRSDKAKETELEKAIDKALKRLIKTIENEPTLVIEASLDKTNVDTSPLEDVRTWLFRGKEATL
jgi:hypothetical protein